MKTTCLILSLILATVWLTGCDKTDPKAKPAATKVPMVRTVTATSRPMAWTVPLTGQVVATQSATISSTIEGTIAQCPWREGDWIKEAGQTLVQIQRPTYQAEVEMAQAALAVAQARLADMQAGARPEEIAQARELVKQLEAQAEFARNDLKRIGQLAANGAIPSEQAERAQVAAVDSQTRLASARQKLDMLLAGPTATQLAVAQASVQETQARLTFAKARLQECTITAPFTGMISRVHVRPGDLASPRTPLLELFDPHSLVVRFAVPEALAHRLATGLKVIVQLDAMADQKFQGSVIRVYPQLDPKLRTRLAEATVTGNPAWSQGMFARLDLVLSSVDKAVSIPMEAVMRGKDPVAATVFVVEDGKAIKRTVKTGIEQNGQLQITNGLTEGQIVIQGGLGRLVDGQAVTVAPEKAKSQSAAVGGGS
jgi:multidrug efflux pump subunit AcrA (membrane-fusion protein)